MPEVMEKRSSQNVLATAAAFMGNAKPDAGTPASWENTYACTGGETSWNSKSADKSPEFCDECQSFHNPLRSRWIGEGPSPE